MLIYFQFCRHSWLASARIQELYESRELDLKMNEIAVLFHHLSDNYKQVSLKKSFVNHCNRTEYIFLYSTGNQSGLTTIIQGIHNITNEQLRGTYYFTTFYLDTIINCNFFSPFQQDKKIGGNTPRRRLQTSKRWLDELQKYSGVDISIKTVLKWKIWRRESVKI